MALPWNSECLGMSAFFRGITETVPSLFRGIFSERNSVPNPISDPAFVQTWDPVLSSTRLKHFLERGSGPNRIEHLVNLKVLSIEMDPVEIRLIR